MTIKYGGNNSAGQPFETGESRAINVANEALDKAISFEGETVIYTVTIKDDQDIALPVSFVADLELDAVKVITGQVFDASVYDPVTFLLTLPWVVPATPGAHTVKLVWSDQII